MEQNKAENGAKKLVIIEKQLNAGHGSWSKIIQVTVNDEKNVNLMGFTLQETISGCGTVIVSGVAYINDKKTLVRALRQTLSNKNVRAETSLKGCVIATLGEMFVKGHEMSLLEAGFIKVHTYDNIAHQIPSGDRYQSIYLLDIPREEAKPKKTI